MTTTGGREPTALPASDASGVAGASPGGDQLSIEEQLGALSLRPGYLDALHDPDHPGHRAAVAERRQLFERAYGNDAVEPIVAGSGGPQIVEREDGSYGLAAPPTADEMTEVAHRATSLTLQNAGLDAETAGDFANQAVSAGLSPLDVSSIAEGIASAREYTSTDQAIAELGGNGAQLIQAAQQEVHRLGLSQELLETEFGGLPLGSHPTFIRVLAQRAGVR